MPLNASSMDRSKTPIQRPDPQQPRGAATYWNSPTSQKPPHRGGFVVLGRDLGWVSRACEGGHRCVGRFGPAVAASPRRLRG